MTIIFSKNKLKSKKKKWGGQGMKNTKLNISNLYLIFSDF